MDLTKITHLVYKFKAQPSGLLPTPKDERDFNTGIFGWFDYKPKHDKHIIKTVSIKNQLPFNTCQWNATGVQKENDEHEPLNVRTLVSRGKKMGLISGNGYSNLRSGQKVLAEWGICPKDAIKESITNWAVYSSANTNILSKQASKRKIATYWSVSSKNDILKLLDNDRIITTGLEWYTAFNQSGGFRHPWIISAKRGYRVGGHAVAIIGYIFNYHGHDVYVCQNSYSDNWGDKGRFYIDINYFHKYHWGCYAHIDDINKDVGVFLNAYAGKNVKGKGDSGIFHIQNGTKKPYPNWESYLAWNGLRRGFTEVDKDVLDQIPKGDIMDIKKTDYWQFLKDVAEGNRLVALLEKLNAELSTK